jgi:hypothetical protein
MSDWERANRRHRFLSFGLATLTVFGGLGLVSLELVPAGATAVPTTPGSALAQAKVLAANPQYAGFSLVVNAGQSSASYNGPEAQSSSQSLNFGELGSLLSGANPCASTAGASPFDTFNALTADSSSGASSTTGGNQVAGSEAVTANPSPEQAGATTSPADVNLPGLLQIAGQSTTQVAYVSGEEQSADAHTAMNVTLVGGLVMLDGLSWTASQHTGNQNVSSGTFTVTSLTIAGMSMPVGTPTQLAASISSVNHALVAFGISVDLPTESTDQTTGTVTVSPLRLQLAGSTLSNAILGKLLPTAGTLETAINKALATNGCLSFAASSGELVGGVVLGILGGSGEVDLDIGGVSADTQAAVSFANPLGQGATSPLGVGSSVASAGSSVPAETSTGPGAVNFSGQATTTTQPIPTSSEPAVALGRSGPVRCVTTSPSGGPGCWRGVATDTSGALLVGGLALLALDFRQSRRRRFLRPKESAI